MISSFKYLWGYVFFMALINVSYSQTKPNIIIIFADDMGYADIGAQGSVTDIKTPNIDNLAKTGVRFTNGYVTAPQCSPSRVALITGRYQQRYDFDKIEDGPIPLSEKTLANRLSAAGYICGQVGKWHLEPNVTSLRWAKVAMPGATAGMEGSAWGEKRLKEVPHHLIKEYMPGTKGFDQYFTGYINNYEANFTLDGKLLDSGRLIYQPGYRLEIQTSAAIEFVKRNHEKPFFLFLNYYGPHVPLEATQKYLDRFPGEMPERRRHALAMISAMDDGVGQLRDLLRQYNIDNNTMIIFASDNGAPLGITKEDVPVHSEKGIWDGSLNYPLNGEKGMLSEGGIRVPYIINWSGLPKGLVYHKPVSTLDFAATAIAIAGLEKDQSLDGVNLIPFLIKKTKKVPHDLLFWRFWNQSAVRSGNWKLIIAGNKGKFLFDLEKDPEEKNNLLSQHPAVAKKLSDKLNKWAESLKPVGIPTTDLKNAEYNWYKHYLNL